MVEVFKTDIGRPKEATPVVKGLLKLFPMHKISIDMQDCDKVLRIEGDTIISEKIIRLLKEEGFNCAVLNK